MLFFLLSLLAAAAVAAQAHRRRWSWAWRRRASSSWCTLRAHPPRRSCPLCCGSPGRSTPRRRTPRPRSNGSSCMHVNAVSVRRTVRARRRRRQWLTYRWRHWVFSQVQCGKSSMAAKEEGSEGRRRGRRQICSSLMHGVSKEQRCPIQYNCRHRVHAILVKLMQRDIERSSNCTKSFINFSSIWWALTSWKHVPFSFSFLFPRKYHLIPKFIYFFMCNIF